MGQQGNMGRFPSESDFIEKRREIVAYWRLRRKSIRQIADILTKEGEFPAGRTTIMRDLEAIRAEWKANHQRDIAEHQSSQLARLEEVQREAWKEENYSLVLQAHDRITRLLGSDAPKRTELTGLNGGPLEVADIPGARSKLLELIERKITMKDGPVDSNSDS